MTERRPRIGDWLHVKGIARLLNTGGNNMNDHATAYVEARGPRAIAAWLALYALHANPLVRADWSTLRIAKAQHQGAMHWRFLYAFRRL